MDRIKAAAPSPLSDEALSTLFAVSPFNPRCLARAENSDIEYKESFGFASLTQYARTMAGFANAEGGYLIFGVHDDLYEVVGMQSEAFDRLDPERLTRELNQIFLPEIKWTKLTREVLGKKLGIVYVYPANAKPVIAVQNNGEIHEAEIFYRYAGRTEKIKYPELFTIIEGQRYRYLNMWLEHLSKMIRIGAENVAILNTIDGVVTGPTGKSFVIDELLLSKLQFIREGEFHEIDGDPTLKLVGTVAAVPAGQIASVRSVPTALRLNHIIHTFLQQTRVDNPTAYIEQICHEGTGFLPIYYFIQQAGLSVDEAVKLIEEVRTRKLGKAKLLQRLRANDDCLYIFQQKSRLQLKGSLIRFNT